MKRALTLIEWLVVIAIVAILLAMAIPAFTRLRLKNHAPQTAEQPEAPSTNRFTVTKAYHSDGYLYLVRDNTTSNEFLFFKTYGDGVAAVPLPPRPWNTP